jgi:hypothetical protein
MEECKARAVQESTVKGMMCGLDEGTCGHALDGGDALDVMVSLQWRREVGVFYASQNGTTPKGIALGCGSNFKLHLARGESTRECSHGHHGLS